jgi:putative N-acetylmannosamine-6-phosphate epimerase
VHAIRDAVGLPVIGIAKRVWSDGRILITGQFEDAQELAAAGATMVALDVTARGQRSGALERLQRIRRELGVAVLADIATVEEGIAAARAGADAVLTTMRGYTDETAHLSRFDAEFVGALSRAVSVPVIAEGRIATPAEAEAAMRFGAWAVIVGTAITRPAAITRGFVEAVRRGTSGPGDILGIDLGGTQTKFGVVDAGGNLRGQGHVPTPAGEGAEALMAWLRARWASQRPAG